MIIYIIFYAAFKTSDYRISLFFTLLYLSLMFSSGYCSIVGKKVNKMKYTYNIINILMSLLYLLSLICSIPVMHFAHEDKNPDLSGYKFNKESDFYYNYFNIYSLYNTLNIKFFYIGRRYFSVINI